MVEIDPQRATVGHHADRPVLVLRENIAERSRDPIPKRCRPLLAGDLEVVLGLRPALRHVRVVLFNLFPRQSGDVADVVLLEPLIRHHGQVQRLPDDLGRLLRPSLGAGIQRHDGLLAQPLRQPASLRPPYLVQRRVGTALDAPLGVPHRASVTDEAETSHYATPVLK